MPERLGEFLSGHLADPATGWNMGSFGAIAEFHHDPGERPAEAGPLHRATARGAIRLDAAALDEIVAVAHESPSQHPDRWVHAVALCLPCARARRAGRAALTELGPDSGAIRPADRAQVLFDMGLGLEQCDFCVRTADPNLLAILRSAAGRPVADPASPAMRAVLGAHPHRVALTAAGRIEVFQKIGGPDTGGVSPLGPHTHVLPKLLATGRTHSANIPVPDGTVPVAYLHPGNPVAGPLGEPRSFDRALHEAFQRCLERFGDPARLAFKRALEAALRRGDGVPEAALDRFGRATLRVTLRQQARLADVAGDRVLAAHVAALRRTHGRSGADPETEDAAPGH